MYCILFINIITIQYPTEWQGGIPRGSIKEEANLYRVSMSPPKQKSYSKIFYFNRPMRNSSEIPEDQIFTNREDALKASNKYRMQESDKLGTTRNKWRQIDEKTIEVRIDENHTFFIDSEYVDFVEKYPTFAKKVHSKFNVIGQDKKNQFQFYSLFMKNIKMIEYIDGNPMNLRKSNLREFGEVTVSKRLEKKAERIDGYDFTIDQYEIFKKIDCLYNLPKNVWILGRPGGTVFERNGVYHARIKTDQDYASKTFAFDNSNKEQKKIEAEKWKCITSYKLGYTDNLIRILDDQYIEVQLTQNEIMRTNIEFIPLIMQLKICSTRGGNEKSPNYATITLYKDGEKIQMKFHNLITQNKMTDHIDGNPLNNTMENLHSCDSYINNINKIGSINLIILCLTDGFSNMISNPIFYKRYRSQIEKSLSHLYDHTKKNIKTKEEYFSNILVKLSDFDKIVIYDIYYSQQDALMTRYFNIYDALNKMNQIYRTIEQK